MIDGLTRRGLLKLGGLVGLGALGGAGGCATERGDDRTIGKASGKPLRVVHFTDCHIQPERSADKGAAMAMRHVRQNAPDAELLIAGGDMIMDSFDASFDRTKLQWDLWKGVVREEAGLAIEYCVGNHDIWGWNKGRSKTAGNEAGWGKRWWMEVTGNSESYKFIDRGRWRIVLLDSVAPLGDAGYEGRLEEEQWAWLERTLQTAPGHVLIVSHIPILCASVLDADGVYPQVAGSPASSTAASGSPGLTLGRGAVMMDCHRFFRLFAKYPAVKGALSGHIHMLDRIDYGGVTYLCNGAVSGGWWRSPAGNSERRRERPRPGDVDTAMRPARAAPGYAVVDLHDDGRVERRYVEYGWVYVD